MTPVNEVKLTRAMRILLLDLPVYHLSGPTRVMAVKLRDAGLVSYKPETPDLHEMWSITRKGRAALQQSGGTISDGSGA